MGLVETASTELLPLVKLGVTKGTERLAYISGTRWDIHIVSIDIGSSKRFRSILARDNRDYSGACFSTPGERYLVMFSKESGKTLVRSYSQDRFGKQTESPAFELSSLAEIANIIVGGLSGELAERQGMGRILSAPTMVVGKKAAIYAQAFGDLRSFSDEVMVDALIHISSPSLACDCTLMLRLDSVTANFLLRPDPDVLQS